MIEENNSQCKLFDAEFRFMTILWEHEPINSTELAKLCATDLGWSSSTAFNMLRKLGERKIVSNVHSLVTANIKQEDVRRYESQALLERAFEGSVPAFVATLVSNKKLSQAEIDAIKRIIDEAQ